MARSLKHVHEIQDCDDRDRDADGPRKNAFHWGAPVVVAGVKRGWGWVGSLWGWNRAAPDRRVGAAAAVLGTLWGNVSRRFSAGDAAKAPARGDDPEWQTVQWGLLARRMPDHAREGREAGAARRRWSASIPGGSIGTHCFGRRLSTDGGWQP